ncbi:MAG: hypothetical protein SO127_08540 [Muribaculaceae bacterium]|nr:hypothetical protein [Muribaculaceae bacterium]
MKSWASSASSNDHNYTIQGCQVQPFLCAAERCCITTITQAIAGSGTATARCSRSATTTLAPTARCSRSALMRPSACRYKP